MKKLLLVFAFLVNGLLFNLSLLHAETVNVPTAGTLSSQLTAAGINTSIVTNPTIIGNLNSSDLGMLKTMATSNSLAVLDLSGATIDGNTIPAQAFYGCKKLTSIILPNTVTSIGNYAFDSCSGLTSISIPNSVHSIGLSAFYGCSGLTTVSIPNSVGSIETRAFAYCSGLTSIRIPSSVYSIGMDAFGGCSGLTTVSIPKSVSHIDNQAFYYCNRLKSVYVYNTNSNITLYSNIFYGLGSATLYVPTGSDYTNTWAGGSWTLGTIPAGILSSPATASLACTEGSTAPINVTSNIAWGATYENPTDSKWLSLSLYGANGNATLAFKATANTSTTARTANITLTTYDGNATLTITVTQVGAVLPTVITQDANNITTTATGNGKLTNLGTPAATSYGICYSSANSTPTITDSKVDKGVATNTGVFNVPFTGLTPNTLYYARAYATNAAGTSYGDVVSFTTMPAPVAPSVGDGSTSNPYQIETLNDLYWLSQTSSVWDKNFIQTANIDASASSSWFGGLGFSPIGNSTTSFTGNYNGQGHVISGLNIQRPAEEYVALFGNASGASIQKLGATGSSIQGDRHVGGITGLAQNNTTIKECFTSFNNINGYVWVGGIAGENNNSTITNVYAIINSIMISQYGGGITGFNNSGGSISFVYASANVTASFGAEGSLVGINSSPVTNSYWNSDVMSLGVYAGSSFNASPLTTVQMKVQSSFTGWDFVGETTNGTADIWAITPDINNGYPCFTWQLSKLAITTQAAIDITTSGATGRGNLSALGTTGYYPTAYGICYSSTNTTPTISDSKINNGAAIVTGAFTSQLTGLVSNTTYYARAYATNAAGTTYGNAVTFNTVHLGVTSVTVPANDTYGIGENLDFTVNFTNYIFVDQTGGIPRIATTIGGTIQYANYVSGSGTSALVFRYTVASGNEDTDGITMGGLSANGGSIKDAGGNDANLTLYSVGSTTGVLVDAIAPAVSITAASSSTYGSVIPVTITFTKSVTGFTADDITVTNATKSNFTGTGTSYTLEATPTATNMVTISIPAAIAKDAAGNDNTAALSINITVNKLKLTVNNPSLTLSKTYDGTAAASVSVGTITNRVTGDDVTATALYNDAIVATDKTITVVYSLSGASASNYSVPDNYVVTTGEINPSKLTVTIPLLTLSKTYDGSISASVTSGSLTNKVLGDDVSIAATASYNDATIGTGKEITVGYSLSGASASNYLLPDNYTVTNGEIQPLKLAVTNPSLTLSKTYDGSISTSVTAGSFTNKVTGDDVSLSATASYNDATAATGKTITVAYSLSGTSTANYSVPDNYVVTNGEINPLKLTVTTPSLTLIKTYDGSTSASVTEGSLINKLTSDDVSITATASYNDKRVGTGKTIGVTYSLNGSEASNYIAPDDYLMTTGIIIPAPLTITLTAQNKPFDGNTQATVTASITQGLITGDDVTVTASNARFDNATIGNGKTVIADISLTGTDAMNYSFSPTATTTASVSDDSNPMVSFDVSEANGYIHTFSSIEISFSEPVNMASSTLKDGLVLREGNAAGAEVNYTANGFLATGASQFTITGDFECGKSYYLAVKSGAFTDPSGNPVQLTERILRTDAIPASPVITGAAASGCPGSFLSISNYNNNLLYQWQMNGLFVSGQTHENYQVSGDGSGNYSVLVQDAATGCQNVSNQLLVNVYPVVAPVIYEKKDQDIVSLLIVDNIANTFTTYKWTLADGSPLPSDMVDNRQFLTLTSTNMYNQYRVRVTDIHGCEVQSETSQIKSAITSTLAYPTVNSGSFKLDLTHPESGKVVVRILSQGGILVKQYVFFKEQPTDTFDVNMERIISGKYMVEISLGNFREVKSIIVQ